MPKLEIEVGEDGSIGTLPEQVQKLLDSKYKEAFGKGAEKAAKEAQSQIEKIEKEHASAARVQTDPAAVEKAKNLEIELSKLKEAEAVREKNFEEAKRLAEERYAKELADRDKLRAEADTMSQAEIAKRDAKLRADVQKDIRVEASKANALPSAIDDIAELLAKYVGLSDDFEPTVNAEAFRLKFTESKLGTDGKPVSIEGLVGEYLSLKPHNRAPVRGTGGRAMGGASLTALPTGKDAEFRGALTSLETEPSIANAANAFSRIGKRA